MTVSFNLSKGSSKPGGKDKSKKEKKGKKKTGSWMRRGKAAASAMKKDEARVQRLKEQSDRLWRFFISTKNIDEEYLVTFLDGEIGDDGMLDAPMWYEHTVQHAGKWENFVCTESVDPDEPCPICAAGGKGSEASLVGVLTLIDHTPYTSKDGKTFQHRRRLFVMKQKTVKQLRKIATKRGGLTGVTMEITRTGDMSARVGDMFEFSSKNPLADIGESLKEDLGKNYTPELIQPADYDEEIVYYTADELVEMGVGQHHSSVGGEAGVGKSAKAEM